MLGRIEIEAVFKFCIILPSRLLTNLKHEVWILGRGFAVALPQKCTLASFTICSFSFMSTCFIEATVNYHVKDYRILLYNCFVWGFSSWRLCFFCCCVGRAGKKIDIRGSCIVQAEVFLKDQSHAAGHRGCFSVFPCIQNEILTSQKILFYACSFVWFMKAPLRINFVLFQRYFSWLELGEHLYVCKIKKKTQCTSWKLQLIFAIR